MGQPHLKQQFESATSGNHYSKNDDRLNIATKNDFLDAGLTADEITVADFDGVRNKDGSAGEGKGSIIMFNGRPMRIIEFRSDKLEKGTFSQDYRNSTIRGQYLDGAGEVEQIGGHGDYRL
jgi:hypothetical protein